MVILTKKQFAVLFVLTMVPFAFYCLGRWDVVGNDGYLYLTAICSDDFSGINPLDSPLFYEILPFLPCNLLFLKLLLFFLCFFCVLALSQLGNLFSENGWNAGWLVWLSPLLFSEFMKFENDQFAYPLLFWSIYFFYKGGLKNFAVSIILVLVAAGFWGGSLYFLVAYALSSIVNLVVLGVPTLVLFGRKLFDSVYSMPAVLEAQPLVGLKYPFLLWIGILKLPLNLTMQLLFFIALGSFRVKFIFLVVPFLAVGTVILYEKTIKNLPTTRFILCLIALIMLFVAGSSVFWQPPFDYDWEAVNYAVNASKAIGNEGYVLNDWTHGYWVEFAGGKTEYKGSPITIETDDLIGNIVLTRKAMPGSCQLLERFGEVGVWKC